MCSIKQAFQDRYSQWLLSMAGRRDVWLSYAGPKHVVRMDEPLTDEVITLSAAGKPIIIYPVGEGNLCWFGALDADPHISSSENESRMMEIRERAVARGLKSVLIRCRTNSYHLINRFAKPQPLERVIAMNKELRGDWGIEIMPRGWIDIWPAKGVGLRMPGLHPVTGETPWVYDGANWFEFGTNEFMDVLENSVSDIELPEAQPIVRPERLQGDVDKLSSQSYGPGPGTELRKLIAELGLKPADLIAHGCSGECDKWSAKMNRWGVDGCKKHRQEIVEQMQKQAANTKSIPKLFAVVKALASRVPVIRLLTGSEDLPLTVGALVDEAIRRAETIAAQKIPQSKPDETAESQDRSSGS